MSDPDTVAAWRGRTRAEAIVAARNALYTVLEEAESEAGPRLSSAATEALRLLDAMPRFMRAEETDREEVNL